MFCTQDGPGFAIGALQNCRGERIILARACDSKTSFEARREFLVVGLWDLHRLAGGQLATSIREGALCDRPNKRG